MRRVVTDTRREMGIEAARRIAALINDHNAKGISTVLGLATGDTPIPMYEELVRMHQEEGLDFSRVVTFNLDEYWPLEPDDSRSYHYYMREHLFRHLDLPGIGIHPENIHIPDGSLHPRDIEKFCDAYEAQIRAVGGIDLQVLGIGTEGHLGFNERRDSDPSYGLRSRTRLVDLSDRTIADNDPPSTQALTMGLGTIMRANELLVLANGEKKAPIISEVSGVKQLDYDIPASLLQLHPKCQMILDTAAASLIPHILPPARER